MRARRRPVGHARISRRASPSVKPADRCRFHHLSSMRGRDVRRVEEAEGDVFLSPVKYPARGGQG
eukprot:594794-Prymnesium_polylepis.1